MRRLKPLEQRWAAIALALFAAIAVYFLCIHWWFVAPLTDAATEMQTLRETRQHYEALLAQRTSLEQQLASASDQAHATEDLLAGPDTGAAAAQLMGVLSTYVQAASVEGNTCSISNRMPINTSGEGAYLPIRVSLNLSCGIEPLAQVLHQIENSQPYLFVDDLTIHGSDPQAADQSANRLAVQLMVSGYMRSAAQSGAAQ